MVKWRRFATVSLWTQRNVRLVLYSLQSTAATLLSEVSPTDLRAVRLSRHGTLFPITSVKVFKITVDQLLNPSLWNPLCHDRNCSRSLQTTIICWQDLPTRSWLHSGKSQSRWPLLRKLLAPYSCSWLDHPSPSATSLTCSLLWFSQRFSRIVISLTS